VAWKALVKLAVWFAPFGKTAGLAFYLFDNPAVTENKMLDKRCNIWQNQRDGRLIIRVGL
jgi:hypothetical protein